MKPTEQLCTSLAERWVTSSPCFVFNLSWYKLTVNKYSYTLTSCGLSIPSVPIHPTFFGAFTPPTRQNLSTYLWIPRKDKEFVLSSVQLYMVKIMHQMKWVVSYENRFTKYCIWKYLPLQYVQSQGSIKSCLFFHCRDGFIKHDTLCVKCSAHCQTGQTSQAGS